MKRDEGQLGGFVGTLIGVLLPLIATALMVGMVGVALALTAVQR